jgi:hypothetical protein
MSEDQTQHRKREYPRGDSPYCSPRPGDVLIASSGDLREVVDVKPLTGVEYRTLRKDHTAVHHPLAIGRGAWAAWCSRTLATLLTEGVPGEVEK